MFTYLDVRFSSDGTFTHATANDRFGINSTRMIRCDNPILDLIVFTRSSTDGVTFTEQSKLHASDAAAVDAFGSSVSLYGDTALIGAFHDDDDRTPTTKHNSGSVYVFKTRHCLWGYVSRLYATVFPGDTALSHKWR